MKFALLSLEIVVFCEDFTKARESRETTLIWGTKERMIKQTKRFRKNPSLPVSASLALLPSVNGFHSEIRVNSRVSRASTFGCGCAALGNPRFCCDATTHRTFWISFGLCLTITIAFGGAI
jgi:hypothetical protein